MADLEGQMAGARTRLKEAAAARREVENVRVRAAEYLRARQTDAHRVEAEISEIADATRRSGESSVTMTDQSGSLEAKVDQAEAAVLGGGDRVERRPGREGSLRRRL